MPEQSNNNDYEARMTFTEHLAELRIRIIRAGIAAIVGMFAAYALGAYLEDALMWPIIGFMVEEEQPAGQGEQPPPSASEDGEGTPAPEESATAPSGQPATPRVRQQWTNILAPVLLRLKVAAYAGLLLASPYIIYQLCAFIFPGLKPNEKRAVRILLMGGSVLAIVGVCIAYFGILPVVIPYLLTTFISPEIELNLRRDETIPIIVKLLTGFAIAFQFPMVVLAVAAAVLTPPDVFSMMVMLVPLLILYEASILLSYLVVRSKKKRAERGEA